jgi:hypothetical protein
MSSQSSLKIKIAFSWNTDYVLSADDAMRVLEVLNRGEFYETKYDPDSKETTQHIYPVDLGKKVSLSIMDETVYHVAKMAGKPE